MTQEATQACLIMDSNALFVPLQFRIDIFEQLERLLKRKFDLILLSTVKQELERLAKRGTPKARKEAVYALNLAEKCVLMNVDKKIGESLDDVIVRVADELRCAVFTNDAELKKRLRDINVPVVYVRQKSKLEADGRL